MADISKVRVKGVEYEIKDNTAREELENKQDILTFATNAEINKLFGINYFCIKNAYNGNNEITFATKGEFTNPPILEYTFDTKNWNNLNLNQAIIVPVNGKIYVRGDNNALAESINIYTHITSTQDIKVSGNIMSLLDKTCELMSVPNYGFSCLFRDCTKLLSLPLLPATSLGKYCYASMFTRCTEIKISTTQTEEYQTPYRIPTSGTGVAEGTGTLALMFSSTGGTFAGTPIINTTYYTSNEVLE